MKSAFKKKMRLECPPYNIQNHDHPLSYQEKLHSMGPVQYGQLTIGFLYTSVFQ